MTNNEKSNIHVLKNNISVFYVFLLFLKFKLKFTTGSSGHFPETMRILNRVSVVKNDFMLRLN